MNAIPSLRSALASGPLLHLDRRGFTTSNQKTLNINLEVVNNAILDLKHQHESLELNTIPSALEDYFKQVAEDIKANLDAINSHLSRIDWTDPNSVMEGLNPVLEYLKPVWDFVEKNPWVLIPLVIPALEIFIGILGFGIEGVVADSIAAALHSRIGNVAKASIFAFLQSVGAKGWAFQALERTNMFIIIAVIIVAIGKILIDKNIVDLDAVNEAMEGTWNRMVEKLDPPPNIPSLGNQVAGLDIARTAGWVRYGVLACVLTQFAVWVEEGAASGM